MARRGLMTHDEEPFAPQRRAAAGPPRRERYEPRRPWADAVIGEGCGGGGRGARLDRLPVGGGEVRPRHSVEGYGSSESAPIAGPPAGTARYRLMTARERLRQELGEGDLSYLNEPLAPMRQWNWLPLDQICALETRLSWRGVGRWASGVGISASGPNAQRLTPTTPSIASKEETMERREFLRQA